MKLFVAGLSGNFDEVDLKEMFELYGDVKSALLIKDRATGKSKGFGFVDMPNAVEAKETIGLLDGVSMYGKQICVKEAEEQPPRTGGFSSGSAPKYGNTNKPYGQGSAGGYGNSGGRSYGNNNYGNGGSRSYGTNNAGNTTGSGGRLGIVKNNTEPKNEEL